MANRVHGFASAVLMSETCSGMKKTAHLCYQQGLVALYYVYEKACTITMGYPVITYTLHKVVELLEQGRFILTQAGNLAYMSLFTYPDITIKHCTTVNPVAMVPLDNEGNGYDCVADIYSTLPRP